MATYTSTQNGNWNDIASWGGGGWPSAASDIVNIGHLISYNVNDDATLLGNITITSGGVLSFPTVANSCLRINSTSGITVNDGGSLLMGTVASPVTSPYIAKLKFTNGVERNVITAAANSIIEMNGDPTFYGTTYYAMLASTWSSGQTLYLVGDFTAKWKAGQYFCINKNAAAYSSSSIDSDYYSIGSVGAYSAGNTAITIAEAAPSITYTAGAYIIMVSRNVQIFNSSVTMVVDAGQSLLETFYGGSSARTFTMNDTWVHAIRWNFNIDSNYTFNNISLSKNFAQVPFFKTGTTLNQCVVTNYVGGLLADASTVVNISGIYAAGGSPSASNSLLNVIGEFLYLGNNGGLASSNSCLKTVKLVLNSSIIIAGSTDSIIEGIFDRNISIGGTSSRNLIIGDIIGTGNPVGAGSRNTIIYGSVSGGTVGFSGSNSVGIIVTGTITSTTPVSVSSNTNLAHVTCHTLKNGVWRQLITTNCGTITPLINGDSNFVSPPSGVDFVYRMLPNSNCAYVYTPKYGMLSTLRRSSIPTGHKVAAGSYNIEMNFYPVGFTSPSTLSGTDIFLEVYYCATTGLQTRTAITSFSTTTYAMNEWHTLSIPITLEDDSIVYWNLGLWRYTPSAYVLYDPDINSMIVPV